MEFCWCTWLVALYVCYIIYMCWHFRLFTKQGIKMAGARIPVLGTLNEMYEKGAVEAYRGYTEKYGKTYGELQGRVPVLSTIETDIIKDFCVKQHRCFYYSTDMFVGDRYMDELLPTITNYDHWKFYRRVISPSFSTGKLTKMIGYMNACGDKLIKHLDGIEEKRSIDFYETSALFAIDVIANTTFSIDIDYDKNKEFVEMAKKPMHNNKGMILMAMTSMFLPFASPFLIPIMSRMGISIMNIEQIEYFRSVTRGFIEERKKNPQIKKIDFLQLLMNAHKPDEDNEDGEELNQEKIQELSTDEILGQSSLFITAAYESTSASIGYLAHSLACNQEKQDKLLEEIDRVCPNGTEVTVAVLDELIYLHMCIQESLRMYPPFPIFQRTASHDVVLANGLKIPKGAVVKVPVYWLHRCTDYYTDPDSYIPERFSPEEKLKRDLSAYMPFGAGPRQCLATRLAMMEIKIAIIHILQRYRLSPAADTDIPMKFKPEFVLKPLNGIHLKMEKRI